jgi:hypothetical protein
VIAGERSRVEDDDTAEATRALREMIETGRLTKAVPMKEPDGRMVTRIIEQDGPIANAETTTRSNVFAEDANRCLLLDTDEGEEQTRRILGATAEAAAGANRTDAAHVCAVHYALQRMLPRVDVVVPFAAAIAEHYPAARLEGRRDFRHLLQLVKASALLHFRQRERDAAGRVVASLFDYLIAERLARAPLGAAASGVTAAALEFLKTLREKFAACEFTTTEATKTGGASPRALYGRLLELDGAGAVEQTAAAKGRVPARWRLTGADPAPGEGVLPDLEDVKRTFLACNRAGET